MQHAAAHRLIAALSSFTPILAALPSISEKVVGPCKFQTFGADDATRKIADCAKIPIGVEYVFIHEIERTISIDFGGGTAAELMNQFAQQAPEYSWKDDGTVIHVFQKAAHVPIADVLMAYPGAQQKTRQEIWEDIQNRPEINRWMETFRCDRQELMSGTEFSQNNDRITVEPGQLTLAQLLDAVIIKSGDNHWVISLSRPRRPGDTCKITIFLW